MIPIEIPIERFRAVFPRATAMVEPHLVMLRKAVSFALVGVVNASVDFGVFSFFYFYLGFPIVAANLISWLIAVTGSYVMNSMTTFAAESGRKLRLKSYATFLLAQVNPAPQVWRDLLQRCETSTRQGAPQHFPAASPCPPQPRFRPVNARALGKVQVT